MATLDDRLDYVLGGKTAEKARRELRDPHRQRPAAPLSPQVQRGLDGARRGRGTDLEEGEHVTFVDVITETRVGDMKPRPGKPKPKYLRRHAGQPSAEGHRHVLQRQWLIDKLVPRAPASCCPARSSYSRARMQLTHPAFLVLDSPSGKTPGTKSLKTIAKRIGGNRRG